MSRTAARRQSGVSRGAMALLMLLPFSGMPACVSVPREGETLPSQTEEDGGLFPDGGGPNDSDPTLPAMDEGAEGMMSGDPEEGGEPSDDAPNETADVPGNAYCAAVVDWDAGWSAFEEDVLRLVNARRAEGAVCGGQGRFDPAGPLAMNAALRCAARVHAADMGARQYFDHVNPEGENPGDRLARAGYAASTWGENIALGYPSPEAVVAGWMASDGHCANIMRAAFSEIGVGYGAGNLWTQVFGAP